jgi:WD40 repeat protein
VLARLDLPSWIYTSHHSAQAQISLPPGGQTTLQLSAYGSSISVGGRVRDMVVMRDANAKLLEIEALTFISRWWMLLVFGRATLRQLPKIIVVGALLVVLTMCCGGGRVVDEAFRVRANAGHYQTGVAAMERGDWQAAVNAFTQIRGGYLDSGSRQSESYYWLGRAALDRKAWPEARAALLAAGQYGYAQDLLKQSYYGEAEQTGRLQLWLNGHSLPTISIAFSPDGQTLASSSEDGTIKLWRTGDGALLHTFNIANFAAHLAFSPDSTILMASDGYGTTRLLRVRDGTLQETIGVGGMLYSPDRTAIAAIGPGSLLKLWRIHDGKLLQTFAVPGSELRSAAFSPDGETLVAAGYEILQYWRVRDGALLGTIKPPILYIRSLAFSPVGALLAFGGNDGLLQIRPLSGDPPRAPFQAHGSSVDSLAFSPDAKLLASGGAEGIVKLWRLADDKQLLEFPKQIAPIRQVVFSPDGKLLAAGDGSGTIIVWRVQP